MLASYIAIFVFLVGTVYIGMQIYFALGWTKYKSRSSEAAETKNSRQLPDLTILVSFRNEAHNLPKLVDALMDQNYRGKLQILLINDHSDDSSKAILENHDYPMLKVEDLPASLHGKKAAIRYGLSQINTPYVLLTDADCTPNRDWATTMIVDMVDQDLDFLAGPVAIDAKDSHLLIHFQQIDVAGMMAITAAGYHDHLYFMANGANIGLHWNNVQNFKIQMQYQWASGDDMALVESVVAGGGKVSYCAHLTAFVMTSPECTWRELAYQRLRWGSKNKGSKQTWLKMALGIGYMQSLLVTFALFAMLLTLLTHQSGGLLLVLAIPFRLLGDLILFSSLKRDFKLKASTQKIGFLSILHSLYISAIGTLSLLPVSYTWKGRRLK